MSKRGGKEADEEKSEPSAVMERLNWQLAWRDDERVAQALYAGEEMEEIHELSEAGQARIGFQQQAVTLKFPKDFSEFFG